MKCWEIAVKLKRNCSVVINFHALCLYFPGIMYSQRARDSCAIKSNSIGWLFYQTLSDWLSSISGRAGKLKGVAWNALRVHNSFTSFSYSPFVVFLVKVCVRCKSVLFNSEGSLLPRISLKVSTVSQDLIERGGRYLCCTLLVHMQVQFVEWLT